MSGVPILLKVELENVKHTLLRYMETRGAEDLTVLSGAFDKLLKPENLGPMIDQTVERALRQTLEESVTHFFKYGPGKKYVDTMVAKRVEAVLKEREQSGRDD